MTAKPVGYYCSHAADGANDQVHEGWEWTEDDEREWRPQPEVLTALHLTGKERRCPHAVPVYAEDVPALQAELEKLRAPFRPAVVVRRYTADRTPALVALPRNAIDFLATLVGGTGSDVWGEVAEHFGLTPDHVRDVYNILTAAAREARCVSCNGDLVRQGDGWVHLGTPGCDFLIVPEHLQ